ncbi:MAG: hypothetical protein H6673_11410 [Anaerolineales bacterium]|nr:hypothetical protein [Anaerolineales bacterium]
MERLKDMPVIGQLIKLLDKYPRLSAWIVLSVGMIGLLIYEARDVDLSVTNWLALIVASVLVAGLCIWIISWEDEEEVAEAIAKKRATGEMPAVKPNNGDN